MPGHYLLHEVFMCHALKCLSFLKIRHRRGMVHNWLPTYILYKILFNALRDTNFPLQNEDPELATTSNFESTPVARSKYDGYSRDNMLGTTVGTKRRSSDYGRRTKYCDPLPLKRVNLSGVCSDLSLASAADSPIAAKARRKEKADQRAEGEKRNQEIAMCYLGNRFVLYT